MNTNRKSSGVRILSALRNPALILAVAAAVGCMESPTRNASPAEAAVITTAAQVLADTMDAGLVYQAENATILDGGVDIGGNATGYWGTGYVGYPHAPGGVVVWQPRVPLYLRRSSTLSFRYSNGSRATASAEVIVNGTVYPAVQFPRTGSWSNWSTVSLVQNLGSELTEISIKVTTSKGMDLDCVTVR